MTIEELNALIKEAKANKPQSPQMDVSELCGTFRCQASAVTTWAERGAPINLQGQSDLFGLFEWLHVNQHHPVLPSVDSRLLALWKIARNM